MDIFGLAIPRRTRAITLDTIAREMRARGYSQWEYREFSMGYGPSRVVYWNDRRGNTVLEITTRGNSGVANVTHINSSVRALCHEVLGIKEGTTVRV